MEKLGKRGEHFNIALAVIFVSIAISLVAFMSEEKNVTGFVVSYSAPVSVSSSNPQPVLKEFSNIDALGTLAKGNYYIDADGIVYWLDDTSKPAVAKISHVRDIQKNRIIYIDDNGNIGYVLK